VEEIIVKGDPRRGILSLLCETDTRHQYNGDNCGMWRNPCRPTVEAIIERYKRDHLDEYMKCLRIK